MSRYTNVWLEFFPESGIVTKHDKKVIDPILSNLANAGLKERTYRKAFIDRETALNWLRKRRDDWGRLDKRYKVRMFTDKQMEDIEVRYTKKQWAETWSI